MTSTKAQAIRKTDNIQSIPRRYRFAILNALMENGIDGYDIDRAMNSRVCDLEDTIPVYAIIRGLH